MKSSTENSGHGRTRALSWAAPIVLAAAVGFALPEPARAVPNTFDRTWVGGPGDWSEPFNWAPPGFPQNSPASVFNVFIDGANPVPSVVTLDVDADINSLEIDVNDTLVIDETRLHIATPGGTISNDGSMSMNPGSGVSFQGNGSLLGIGELDMGPSANTSLWSIFGILTNGAGHTISGGGNLLIDLGGMVNQGTIRAEGPIPMIIDPQVNSEFVNQGTMEAAMNSAGFDLRSSVDGYNNTGGTIEIGDGSRLKAGEHVVIEGGILRTLGDSGSIDFGGGPVFGVSLDSVVVQGTVNHTGRVNALGFASDASWDATWNMSSGASLKLSGLDVAFNGTGEIVMDDSPGNEISLAGVGGNFGTLTLGPNHTIRGSGSLLDDDGAISNEGTIVGDQPTPLFVNPGGSFTNQDTGTVEARDGGTVIFDFDDVIIDNTLAGGTWRAFDGSAILFGPGQGQPPDNVTTNAAKVFLNGMNSGIPALNRLDTNTGSGSFNLENGRNFVTFSDFTNAAEIRIAGAGSILDVDGEYTQTGPAGEGGPGQPGTTTLEDATLRAHSMHFRAGSLLGTGTVEAVLGDVVIDPGVIVSPGLSFGEITIDSNLLIDGGATLEFEIDGSGSVHDKIMVTGNAILGDGLTILIDVVGPSQLMVGDEFDVLTTTGLLGLVGSLNIIAPLGFGFDGSKVSINSESLLLRVTQAPPPAPEPGTLLLAAAGLILLVPGRARRAGSCFSSRLPSAA